MYAIPSVNSTLLHRVKDTQRITFAQVDYEESIKRTFTRGHVHLDTADLYRMTLKKLLISDKEMCTNTSKVLVRGGDIHGGFYSRKGFGFKDLFNSKLMKIKERGLVSRYYESYLREYVVECQRTRKQYDDNIGLEDLVWLFSGLFGCIAFTFIEVSVEIMIRKRVRLRESLLIVRTR